MGYGQDGLALRQAPHRIAELPFRISVQRAGDLIQDQQLRAHGQSSSQGDSLALAAGNLRALLADRRGFQPRLSGADLAGDPALPKVNIGERRPKVLPALEGRKALIARSESDDAPHESQAVQDRSGGTDAARAAPAEMSRAAGAAGVGLDFAFAK